ncbi:MAG: hypothetical protein ABI611_03945 [Solirubrobacteraceae bacterium]
MSTEFYSCRVRRSGGGHPPRVTIEPVRTVARAADLLLVAFLVCLALTTAAQLRHNEAAGSRGHAPHDRPVSHRIVR